MQWTKIIFQAVVSKSLRVATLIILIQACAYVPVTKPQLIHNEDCQLISKELQLEEKQLSSGGACSGPACSVFLIIPASTFLVSGSVVLIGNSLHWLEKNGTCSDGLIRKNLEPFIDWAFNIGGKTVEQ